jgi:hypothetical protein
MFRTEKRFIIQRPLTRSDNQSSTLIVLAASRRRDVVYYYYYYYYFLWLCSIARAMASSLHEVS